jgi:histidine triad (HIT) family protein
MENCIFCKIIKGEAPSHKVWEDEKYIAFLSIFPNTKGATVVITKAHYDSYAFDLPDEVLSGLIIATKKVAKMLDERLDDVGRTGMVFEGFGVNHIHSKLFPMHGTKDIGEWKPIEANIDKYFEKYEGYISSHDYIRADDNELALLVKKLRGE